MTLLQVGPLAHRMDLSTVACMHAYISKWSPATLLSTCSLPIASHSYLSTSMLRQLGTSRHSF